jgi:hypothetical protein
MIAGQIPIAASPSSLAGSIPFGLTGSSTLVRTNVGGAIDPSLIGDASIAGAKLAPGAISASLGYTPASAAVTITPAAPLTGGGDLSTSRTIGIAGPANLTTFSANTIPKGAGISAFAASSIADGGSGVTIGVPTGGPQGPGTLNVQGGIFSGGVAVGSGGGSANISGMTAGQLGVAGNPTSLTSSVPFGQTGTNTVLQTGAGGAIAASVIPPTTVTPGSCTNCNLTITADGRITVQGNGTGGGVNALIGDVTAGPGAGSIPSTVTGMQGRAISPASPSDQDVIAWNAATSRWEPFHTPLGAMNQLTGDGTAGPGSGSQALTLATVNSTPGMFAAATFDAKGRATITANLTGDVTTSGRTRRARHRYPHSLRDTLDAQAHRRIAGSRRGTRACADAANRHDLYVRAERRDHDRGYGHDVCLPDRRGLRFGGQPRARYRHPDDDLLPEQIQCVFAAQL